jgi:hypothetical protein
MKSFLAESNRMTELAKTVRWSILNSFAEQLANNRPLSEKQLAVVLKAEMIVAERKDQPTIVTPEGRVAVTFKVIKLKDEESFAPVAKRFHSTGWSPSFQSPVTIVTKVLGETADGAKVWGNLPKALKGKVAVGESLTLTATFVKRDNGFSCFSRAK